MYQSTLDGRFIEVDPLFADMLGYRSPQDMLENIKDIGAQLYVERDVRAHLVEELLSRGGICNFETRVYRKDGRKLWVSEYCRTLRGSDGSIARFQGAFADINDYKRAGGDARVPQGPVTPRLAPAVRGRRVPVKDGTRIRFMDTSRITYIKADGDYVHVHTEDAGHLMARDKIGSLALRLDSAAFARISKSVVVNLNYVREMRSRRRGSYEFVMDCGTQLPSGPTYGAVVRQILEELE
jgi:PAS domain S-box-containing protein